MTSIPKSFKLANRTWRVSMVKNLVSPEGEALWGLCQYAQARISLDEDLARKGNEELLAHTFEHELHHAMLLAHGWRDHEERLVEGMAGLRRQYELTKRLPVVRLPAGKKEVIQTAGKRKAPRGRRKPA